MILSMTGYGAGEVENEYARVGVEVRSVNQRYFRAKVHMPDYLLAYEKKVEDLVKAKLSRGSVFVRCKVKIATPAGRYHVSRESVLSYIDEIGDISKETGLDTRPLLDCVLSLPGSIEGIDNAVDAERMWPMLESALSSALDAAFKMKKHEGAALDAELRRILKNVETGTRNIRKAAPRVVEEYRIKLEKRIKSLLKGKDAAVQPAEIAREVAFFSDRADITEELARLAAHVKQFRETMKAKGPGGRKLEFIAQEMLREANTIGSKANHSGISADVVELKTEIDRLKEQVLNVE